MEDLEKFHQFLLFTLIDVNIPLQAKYVTVDSDGEITLFENRPTIQAEVFYWRSNNGWWDYVTTRDGTVIVIKTPEGISWKDCIWKL